GIWSAAEGTEGMEDDGKAPAEERPRRPPDFRSRKPIDGGQASAHQQEDDEVDIEADHLVHLLCGLHGPLMLVHVGYPLCCSRQGVELTLRWIDFCPTDLIGDLLRST